MTAKLLVNITPSETRVSYIDGSILQEIHIEGEAWRGIAGNVYKGRVSRVLQNMQAAFVNIGLDKAVFLTLRILYLRLNAGPAKNKRTFRCGISPSWCARWRILCSGGEGALRNAKSAEDHRYQAAGALSGLYALRRPCWRIASY